MPRATKNKKTEYAVRHVSTSGRIHAVFCRTESRDLAQRVFDEQFKNLNCNLYGSETAAGFLRLLEIFADGRGNILNTGYIQA